MNWLRRRFIWTTMCLSLLALAAVALLIAEINRFSREQADAQLLETTRALSLVVDGEIRRYEAVLQTLAMSESLERRDFVEFDRRARALFSGPDAWIILGDRSGQQFINTRLAPQARLPNGPSLDALFERLARGTHICDLSRGLVEPLILCVDVPVRQDGGVAYVLSVIFRPAALQHIIENQRVPASRYATVLDRTGTVVWRNVEAERFVGQKATPDILKAMSQSREGVTSSVSLNGVPAIVAYSRSRSGLIFLVAVPQTQIRAATAWSLRYGLIVAGALLALAALIAFLAARRLAGAIGQLAKTTARISSGEPISFACTGIPEIDEVGAKLTQSIAERDVSNERFRLAQEAGGVGAWDWDVPGDRGTVTFGYKRLHGLEHAAEPFSLRQIFAVIHPEDQARYREHIAETAASGEITPHEYRVVHADGSVRWVSVKGRTIRNEAGDVVRAVGIVRDVTLERAAQQALRDSEARLAVATRAAQLGVWDWDVVSGHFDYSRRAREIYGLRPNDSMTFEWLAAATHPDDRAATLAQNARALDPAIRDPAPYEYRIIRADGSVRWILAHGEAVFTDGTEPRAIRYVGTIQDITDRKALEQRLQRLTEELHDKVKVRTAERDRLWALSQDPFVVSSAEGVWIEASPAWERILGWRLEELVGRTSEWMEHPDDRDRTQAERVHLADGGTTTLFVNRFRARNGSYRWFAWNAATDAASDFVYGVARDVTEEREREAALKQTQEALVQSQKVEAIGKVTGGVAHDVNNLLTPILGGLDLLSRRGMPDARAQALVTGALEAAERARVLVQRLLAFGRRQPLQAGPIDIGKLAHGMQDLIASTLGPRIHVSVVAPDDLPLARADRNQLEMALLNLAVNARDAMPDGGRIAISAAAAGDDRPAELPVGRFIKLSVTDTGVGMPPEVASRAIEPFFSTKGIGKGSGLGLSMAHGLLAQLGGSLVINSTVGVGTTIDMWLPIASEGGARTHVDAPAVQLAATSGTALLVDDEDLVRSGIAAMLADLGYAVAEAASAAEALRMLEAGLQAEILVTDHLMPGMTGTELARTALGRWPSLRIVIVSGYADVDDIAPDLPRLSKPFRQDELARALALQPGKSAARLPA